MMSPAATSFLSDGRFRAGHAAATSPQTQRDTLAFVHTMISQVFSASSFHVQPFGGSCYAFGQGGVFVMNEEPQGNQVFGQMVAIARAMGLPPTPRRNMTPWLWGTPRFLRSSVPAASMSSHSEKPATLSGRVVALSRRMSPRAASFLSEDIWLSC